MASSHSICFFILLTNKRNLTGLLCDCFSIIRRSDRLVTGMVHLQSGFCHKLGLTFNDLGAGDNFVEIILPSFSRHLAEKLLTLMSFPLKTYLNKQTRHLHARRVLSCSICYADHESSATPLPRNSSPKNKEINNRWYKIKNHLCQISLNGWNHGQKRGRRNIFPSEVGGRTCGELRLKS